MIKYKDIFLELESQSNMPPCSHRKMVRHLRTLLQRQTIYNGLVGSRSSIKKAPCGREPEYRCLLIVYSCKIQTIIHRVEIQSVNSSYAIKLLLNQAHGYNTSGMVGTNTSLAGSAPLHLDYMYHHPP